MNNSQKKLRLTFHGRIIDHLGIQMYQSPVAAVAELISNAWDADAETVDISLPDHIGGDAQLIIKDDGIGMTFNECQDHYLNVGWCRRGDSPDELSPEKERPVLGRKGIGKFAGFGIATIIRVETVSKRTGEKTLFELNIDDLRSDAYVESGGGEINLIEYLPPDDGRKPQHGTSVILKNLKIGRRPSPEQFTKSMARRFLLHQRVQDFRVCVNNNPLPDEQHPEGVEYAFPRDYRENEKPRGIRIENGRGIERLSNNRQIKWRFLFYRDPIEEEELRGIAVFSRGKLAQKPFFFNLSGGLGGQHGQQYMSGQIEADYVDKLEEDLIATERQRINWEHTETVPLEEWGQNRIKSLLRIWRDRRGESRRREIEEKVATFSDRLGKLPSHEQRTVKRALTSLGGIPTLSDLQFQSLGEAILQAWEQGRLRELIDDLSTCDDVTTEWLLAALAEADVLIALNLAEAVRTKLEAIRGLKTLVEKRELENAVRDYIAEKPYLLHPQWETFRKEVSVKRFMDEAAKESGLEEVGSDADGERKRIDLALRSNEHLLIVEFMRPGKRTDWDHLSRCRRYVLLIRDKIEAETALNISKVTGLIVADRLDSDASVRREIQELEKSDIFAFSWPSLLEQSERTWREFLEIVGARARRINVCRSYSRCRKIVIEMADNLTPEERSRCMSRVKNKDTDIERLVRSELHKRGFGFRKHLKALPGTPDIVFSKAKVAVFIDGDFWHGYRFTSWENRVSDFWKEKIRKNRDRDRKNFQKLRNMGWQVIRLWKHEVKTDMAGSISRITKAISEREIWNTKPTT